MQLDSDTLKNGRTLRALGWHGQLAHATNPEAVLSVARDYLAQVSPEEVAQLPEECRPVRLVDDGDLAAYAVTLARHLPINESNELLQKLSVFFTDATVRMSEVLAQATAGRRRNT